MDITLALKLSDEVEFIGRRGRERNVAWDAFVKKVAGALNGKVATLPLNLLNQYATADKTPAFKSLPQALGRFREVAKTLNVPIKASIKQTEDKRGTEVIKDTPQGKVSGRYFLLLETKQNKV